ncbi:hypothetical protein TNCV_4780681 [Trichonephila clavipes]|nr:hypothetical protein TNCV_4780681 [Trichonephila clavipes]
MPLATEVKRNYHPGQFLSIFTFAVYNFDLLQYVTAYSSQIHWGDVHVPPLTAVVFWNMSRTCREILSLRLVIEHVTGPPAPNSSKKYGPRIKDVENPHHTVTFGECSGTCKVECGSSDSQIRQL